MKIKVLDYTDKPMQVISRAAGTSYGKDDVKASRVLQCFNNEHLSVFEHASVTFRVEGISRACSHQLVRHRLASFVQQSQRYTKIDTTKNNWYVTPEVFIGELEDEYFNYMSDCGDEYKEALAAGIKPEDARYLLPEATKTTLTVTMNIRELFHFLDLREDKAAQWEIREMALALDEALSGINDEWGELMELRK